ncbi:MAG: NAD(P)H-hydrate dehydratase [Pseudomonadota bacterium]
MKCASAAEMRELDRQTIEDLGIPGLVLMEVAGRGVADVASEMLGALDSFVVVAGPGNNGGDGYVAARHLLGRGHDGHVVLVGDPARLSADAAAHRGFFLALGGQELLDDGEHDLDAWLQPADLVIDALFGTGLARDVEGRPLEAIAAINGCGKPVLAVDLPSGLDADSGRICGEAVQATRTVTLGLVKRGLVTSTGAALAGEVAVCDIGIPPAFVDKLELRCEFVDRGWARQHLPVVAKTDHKGTRGHVLVVAGSTPKAGAAWLAARGALRAGAGLCTLLTSPGARARMGADLPELMAEAFARGKDDLARMDLAHLRELTQGKDALLLGPGLAHGGETAAALEELLAELSLPAVVDAEGLNLLAGTPAAFKAARALVLTPHPGEMARLLSSTVAEVQADRFAAALACAAQCQQVVLLKGARTVIAAPDGRHGLIPIEHAALGTAGSGDVLGGVVAALLARGLSPYDAACTGAYLHVTAGVLAAEALGQTAVLASDIADRLGTARNTVLGEDA